MLVISPANSFHDLGEVITMINRAQQEAKIFDSAVIEESERTSSHEVEKAPDIEEAYKDFNMKTPEVSRTKEQSYDTP